MKADRPAGLACGALAVLIYAGLPLVTSLGHGSDIATADIAALRFGIGGVLMLPVVLRHGLAGIALRHAAAIAFLGGLGFAGFAYAGIALAPAAHAGVLLHGTLPLFTFAMLFLAGGAAPGRRRIAGLALILAGTGAMAADSLAAAGGGQLLGDLCFLAASACWAGYGIVAARLGLPPVRAAALVSVLSMLAYLPAYALFAPTPFAMAPGPELAGQAAFHGVVLGALSVTIYTRAVAALGAGPMALLTASVPCLTTLAAIPLLGQIPTATAAAGVATVSAGMLAALWPGTR